jgi:hypothetical protein
MDVGKLLKWIVIIGVIVFGVKVLLPWLKGQQFGGRPASITSAAGDDSCAGRAERASEEWGSGLVRFINPPYDLNAWSSFRGGVESKISAAESQCGCANPSCTKVREAMTDLRGMVADMDAAIRNGSSPGSIVQRQEAIDNHINEARDLQTAGK